MQRRAGRALAFAAALVLFPGIPGAAKLHRVLMEGVKFAPETLEVAAGDTVVWVNRDAVPHTVSAGKSVESGTIGVDAEWKLAVRQKGRLDYICRFHPGMRGTLIVK
jgi:plastocyanin